MSLALPLRGKDDICPHTYQYPKNGAVRGGLHHDPFHEIWRGSRTSLVDCDIVIRERKIYSQRRISYMSLKRKTVSAVGHGKMKVTRD